MNPSNKARPPGSRADNRGVWANHSSEALGRGLRLCVDAKLDQRGLLRGKIALFRLVFLCRRQARPKRFVAREYCFTYDKYLTADNEVGLTTLN